MRADRSRWTLDGTEYLLDDAVRAINHHVVLKFFVVHRGTLGIDIVPGQRIIEGNVKVSPLTEAIYLQVQDKLGRLSDAQLMTHLDAAAQLTVGDVSGDGVVDYLDALRWHRVLDPALQ